MDNIIGLKEFTSGWSSWILVGRVDHNDCGDDPIAICTLDELRVAWNKILPPSEPTDSAEHRPPPEGDCAKAVRNSIVVNRLAQGQPAALAPAVEDPAIKALQLQDLRKPTPEYATLYPSTHRLQAGYPGPGISGVPPPY